MTRLGILRGLKNSLAFLTVIPVGMDEDGIAQAAEYMPSFPIIGAMIGFICGLAAWALGFFLPSLIVGMLGLAFILLLTGVHHADGLLDFGDAVMFRGSAEEKIRVMHDQHTGAGGLALGIVVLLTTAFGIATLDRGILVQAMTASEASAKFAMAFQAWAGRSASKGLNSVFVDGMHGKERSVRLATALGSVLIISLVALKPIGILVTLAGLLSAVIILRISHRQFGGITGDVMGATNELSRMISLLVVLVAAKWV
jgi:adenosylcobinamide-GDP ribazoletransferase